MTYHSWLGMSLQTLLGQPGLSFPLCINDTTDISHSQFLAFFLTGNFKIDSRSNRRRDTIKQRIIITQSPLETLASLPGRYQRAPDMVIYPPPFERLPLDILHHILLAIGSTSDLHALIRASPVIYRYYRLSGMRIRAWYS